MHQRHEAQLRQLQSDQQKAIDHAVSEEKRRRIQAEEKVLFLERQARTQKNEMEDALDAVSSLKADLVSICLSIYQTIYLSLG